MENVKLQPKDTISSVYFRDLRDTYKGENASTVFKGFDEWCSDIIDSVHDVMCGLRNIVAYINHGAPIDDPTVIENVVANIRHYTERIIPDMNELYTLLGGKRRLPNGSFMPTMFNAFVRLTPAGDAVCRLCRETVDRLIHYVFGTDSKKIDVFSLENFIRSSLMLIEDIEVGNTTKYINRNNNRANNTLVVISTKMPEEESDSRDYRIRSVESLRKLIKLSQRS